MKIPSEIFKNVRRIQIRTNKYVEEVLSGAYHSAFKGRGMEFEDVREYQPGDEVRSIDWNVTAKMQYPYVKNYREERELTVMLLVDVSASSLFGTTGKKKSELIAELSALFAFSAVHNQDKVGLILFSDRIEKFIPAQKGQRHALRLIRELLTTKPKNQKTDIAHALSFLGNAQKRKSVIFLISDFISPPFLDELTLLGQKHDLIGVKVKDPREALLPKMGLVQFKDLETQKTYTLDTSPSKVRHKIYQRQQTCAENLSKQFDRHANGLIELTLSQSYMENIRMFFNKRQNKR